MQGRFRGVSEVSRNHSGFSFDNGCAPFGYKISRGIHSGLNSGVTGFSFGSKLRKCRVKTFFFSFHEGKLETFAKIRVAASLKTLREDPTVCIRGCLETTQRNL